MPRPALLPVEHPLSYSYTNPSGTEPTGCLLANPNSLEDKVQYLFEHQQVTNLLNDYAYILDVCMVDSSTAHRWGALFTDDCSVTFPFGTHNGKTGLADWCLNAELRFHRMLHMSSNFTITFESGTVAHGRTVLFGICGTHPENIGENFSEGGYYYWTFRKVGNEWKISYLFLDVNWVSGDSKGLNEPGAAADESGRTVNG